MNAHTPGLRVLILDDDAAVRETLLAIVEWAGFTAQGVKCGDDFLKTLHKFKPDLSFLTLFCPTPTG